MASGVKLHDDRGHTETVRTLVNIGHANVNFETRAGKTPLIEAARYGRTAVVRLLMELRAIIPYKNRRGQTAAWWAKRLSHQECLVPIAREIKAESALRFMSSQIGENAEVCAEGKGAVGAIEVEVP